QCARVFNDSPPGRAVLLGQIVTSEIKILIFVILKYLFVENSIITKNLFKSSVL
ncbi:unnamed protein product, partial [marine sediment metagenome]